MTKAAEKNFQRLFYFYPHYRRGRCLTNVVLLRDGINFPGGLQRVGTALSLHAFTGELRFGDRPAQCLHDTGQLLARLEGRKLGCAILYGIV